MSPRTQKHIMTTVRGGDGNVECTVDECAARYNDEKRSVLQPDMFSLHPIDITNVLSHPLIVRRAQEWHLMDAVEARALLAEVVGRRHDPATEMMMP